LFYLNGVLVQYLVSYTTDVEIIYCMKNCLVDPRQFVKQMLERPTGFDNGHYILTRIKTTSVLLQLLSKFIKGEKEKNRFAVLMTEMVLGQLGEEYLFVKAVVQAVLSDISVILERESDETFIVSFLMFYERFIWNNKKMRELFDLFQDFIHDHNIIFPSPLIFFDEETQPLNHLIIEHSDKLSIYKLKTEKVSSATRSAQTTTALSELCDLKAHLSENVFLFGHKAVLGSMDMQIAGEGRD
jgi:hypothetical protein